MNNDSFKRRYQNNEITIKNLFHESMGLDARIDTHRNIFFGEWLRYDRFELVAPRRPTLEIIKFVPSLLDIYGVRSRVLPSQIARIAYISSFGILASASMSIEGIDSLGKNMIFWLRRHSIRLFDFSSGQVTCFLNDELPNDAIINSIKFRQKYNYPFLIELIDSGDNWFREKILSGTSLSKIKNAELYKQSVKLALNDIKELGRDTINYQDNDEYIDFLREDILKKLLIYEKSQLINGNFLRLLLDKLCLKAAKSDKPVPIVLAHGDFHSNNILVDNNNHIYIIDWETNSYRSIWYDPATLLCKFKFRAGMRNLWLDSSRVQVKDAILINDQQKNYNMESVAAILILERLHGLFSLMHLNFQNGRQILGDFTENLHDLMNAE